MFEPAPDLSQEIAAFLKERVSLKAQYASKWVVFSGPQFRGAFDDYEQAARFAIEHFRDTNFLVRNLDAEDEQVPLIFADVG